NSRRLMGAYPKAKDRWLTIAGLERVGRALQQKVAPHFRFGSFSTEAAEPARPLISGSVSKAEVKSQHRCVSRSAKSGCEQSQQRARYSIPPSARASSVGGTSMPSALAVFRLITSSYLVGACTGRSAGFSPFRTRST